MTGTATGVLTAARGQIGYNGTGSSSSPSSKFGRWYGIDPGQWCAMFVSWALHAGGQGTKIRTAKGFAYVPDVVAYAKARKQWVDRTEVPRAGDIVVFEFGGMRPDHVGIVESAKSTSSITSVQGNTTDASQGRTGNSCRRKVHSNKYVVGYWRPPYVTPSTQTMYTVVSGDTLARIAVRNHTTVPAIMKLNSAIKNPNVISVGQKIRIK